MDPTLISAGIGLLGSLFGSKPQTPQYVLDQYRLLNNLISKGIDLYDSTDFNKLDQQAVQTYGDAAMQRAMGLLSNYDAKAAGGGSPYYKSDTVKDRAKVQIAADSSLPVAQFQAGLISSQPNRRAALLPNPSNASLGFGPAQYLDQTAQNQSDSQLQGIMAAASLLGKYFGKKGPASSGANDRYGSFDSYGNLLPPDTTYDPYKNVDRYAMPYRYGT